MTTTHPPPAPPAPSAAPTRDRLQLEPPPRLEHAEGAGGVLMNAIPMLGSLGSIALVATMGGNGAGGRQYLAAGMFLLATLGFVAVQIDRQRARRGQQVSGARTDYLRYLGTVRRHAREAADEQRRALTWRHPEPASLPAIAEDGTRIWERASADPDFLHVRYAVCDQPLALDLIPPEDEPSDRVDPVAVTALHRLLRVHRRQSGLPTSIDLRAFDRIEVCGPEGPARSLARAMICSAAAFHSPDDLVIAVLTSERFLAHWDWIKWLPHAQSARQSDAIGARRMVSTSLDQLAELLPSDLLRAPIFEPGERTTPPHILVVLDGAELPPGNQLVPPGGGRGVTVLDLPAQWDELEDASRLRLEFEPVADTAEPADGRYPVRVLRVRDEPTTASVDQCSLAVAEALARRLTPLHTVRDVVERADAAVAGTADFVELLGLEGVRHFDPDRGWLPRPARDVLRVPIGTDDAGAVVHLDLKESAQQGMGPHGLVIGATGSGKSEFLRTLVLGLAMTHSPEQLNLVLVDFKGGATFAGMAPLPHVSAVITNLAQELTLVDRMEDALSGELVRRQELLREAGNFASIHDYERARAAGRELPALPSLVVVVDEFSELLAAKPEFIELFVAIGRLGRSLGLHLLLASQRLDEGRLRGLESHLSYRVGLRTFSAHESRAVLGVPDAYELPPVPGLAYLKPDPATLVRFTTAYVSGPSSGPERVRRDAGQLPGIAPFTISEVSRLAVEVAHGEPEPVATPDQRSVLELGVEQLIGHGPPAHPIWLPPLDVPDTIDQLLPDLAVDPQLGLVSCEWRARGLVVPLGTLDRPREQRRDTFSVDLGGDAGHFAVVGGPRSGKSTVLRSLVAGLALTTTPTETQLFVLDLGGGLTTLAGLPHVAGVATRTEPEVLSRIVAEAAGIIDRREAYFRAHGIDSIETYRSQRAQGRVDDGYGEVFLVVDGWSVLRAEFDDAERELQQLSTRGLALGLHIVATAGRWTDFRAAMRDQFGSRLELRLGDPLDSEFDRRVAALVPQGRPGRGLAPSALHFLGALPRIDGEASVETLGAGIDDLVRRVRGAWPGPPGPKLRLLPGRIPLDDVHAQAGVPARLSDDAKGAHPLLVGIDERELAPVAVDPATEPHLLVLGERGSGKSTLLRALARELMRTRTPEQAQLVVIDHRRALLGEVPDAYLLHYLTSTQRAELALRDLAAYLERRIPGPDVTPDQLRTRSWWTGAEVFVLVDDYDLVATQQGSPLAALQPLLAQARDVGLHLTVARRTGGASRALYDPVLQSLRDLAMPGLMLAGNPDEGPLLGNLRPAPAPAGRARLITRERGVEVVQLAWTEPVT